LVANNFVSVAANNSDGIYLYYTTYQNIYYNSVNARGGTGSNALVQNQGNNLHVVNNILAASNGGRAYYVNQPAAIGTSDYNDFYTTGANLARWGSTDITDLAALQTASGKDPNSISANPIFASATNLHVKSAAVDSAGTPLTEVSDDIDDELRDATHPDIGADEFVFGVNNLPNITSQPDTSATVDSLYAYQVVATDNDGDTLIYRLVQAPAFLTIDPDSGLIQGIPSQGDVGDHVVSIEVDDQNGGIASQIYTLHVEQATGIDPFANQIPDKFVIYQNYPNPFNPETNIRFGIPTASHVKIEIYNTLGQKVVELINEYKPAGYYSVSFNASKYASGIYIYRMVAENYQEIKKMMLIK
ncbi:MAG: T9SS type A sorting domain-containing protein, partial [bacterium]